MLVWPQMIAADGARTALQRQQQREQELSEQLEVVRAMSARVRTWQKDGRKVFLREEVRQYPALVRAVAQQNGVTVAAAQVTSRPSPRWHSATLHPAPLAGAEGLETGGEITPRMVRLVLTGSFDGLYRAVATLCRQPQAFIPDRWDLTPAAAAAAPAGSGLRAEIWGTLFVVDEPGEGPRPSWGSRPMIALVPGDETGYE